MFNYRTILNQNFESEFSNQQDIGTFFDTKQINFSLSLFNNFIQNYIYLAQLADEKNLPITDAQGNRTFQYQQAKAQLYGLETSLDFHPALLKGFSMIQNFQFVHGYNRIAIYKNTRKS